MYLTFHDHAIPENLASSKRYSTRFARTEEDLAKALRLRFHVFNEELGEGLTESEATGLDRDQYDASFHHLLVETVATGEVIGTYRMQTAEMARDGAGFYSNGEYDLAFMPESILHGAIEVGRACIARDHRNGKVLFLLWKGMMRYLLHNKKHLAFGCCSITSQDPEEGLSTYEYLQANGHVEPSFSVPPRKGFVCKLPTPGIRTFPTVKIPQLMKIYLSYGAKICSPAAIDRQFKTIDFLTLLDIHHFDEKTFQDFAS